MLPPAYGQGDSPAIAATRRLFHDYLVVPGERIGIIRLGDKTINRFNFSRIYKLTYEYGLRPLPEDAFLNWPEERFARAPLGGWDQPLLFFFCRSNEKLFATMAFGVAPWYAEAEKLWELYAKLKTPEEMGPGPLPDFIREYGQPLAVREDTGVDASRQIPRPFHFLREGVVAVPHPSGRHLVFLGTYNLEVCSGGEVRGTYFAHIGRVEPGKVLFSTTGNVLTATIGNQLPGSIPDVRSSQLVYTLLELTFPSARKDTGVLIRRKITTSEGEVVVDSTHFQAIKQGESRLVRVFEIGWRPRRGEFWTVEFLTSDGTLLGTGTFRNSN